jgi:hypothetical protein
MIDIAQRQNAYTVPNSYCSASQTPTYPKVIFPTLPSAMPSSADFANRTVGFSAPTGVDSFKHHLAWHDACQQQQAANFKAASEEAWKASHPGWN